RDMTNNDLPIGWTQTNQRSFTIPASKLTEGHQYRLWVASTNASGIEYSVYTFFTITSSPSAITQPTPSNNLNTPVPVFTPVSTTQIDISWNQVEGAVKYSIRRANSEGGSFTHVYSLADTKYSDVGLAQGASYWYKISSIDAQGNEYACEVTKSSTLSPLAPAFSPAYRAMRLECFADYPKASQYKSIIDKYSQQYNIDANLIASIIASESSFNSSSLSNAGAKGMMQLTDTFIKYLGNINPYNAEENIKGGTRIMSEKIYRDWKDCPPDIVKFALASYNSNNRAVNQWRNLGNNKYSFEWEPIKYKAAAETRNYVDKIWKRWASTFDASVPSFYISSPTNGVNLNTDNVVVSWTSLGGATSYKLGLADITNVTRVDEDGVKIIDENSNILGTSTSYTIPSSKLESGRRYRVYVAAESPQGEKWSVTSFNINPESTNQTINATVPVPKESPNPSPAYTVQAKDWRLDYYGGEIQVTVNQSYQQAPDDRTFTLMIGESTTPQLEFNGINKSGDKKHPMELSFYYNKYYASWTPKAIGLSPGTYNCQMITWGGGQKWISPDTKLLTVPSTTFVSSEDFWASRTGTGAAAWCYPFRNNRDTSNNFGQDRDDDNNGKADRAHAGVDLHYQSGLKAGTLGDEVLAMSDGIVLSYDPNFYQNTDCLAVLNTDQTIIRYTEIRSNLRAGAVVKRGQKIGNVITNNDGSRMLHLEVYYNHDADNNYKVITGTTSELNANKLTQTRNNYYLYVLHTPPKNLSYERRKDLVKPNLVSKLYGIDAFKNN
ncbi:MAG: transglycosylase SLT domain-containing protein, partial [Syntrophomonas sp.]